MLLLAQLAIEVEAGRVRQFSHPTLPLTGYNYTETCQFDRGWNATNMQCRGLVLDPHGRVVARPLRKFFNFEELPEANKVFSPEDITQINQKEDGSLIIAFHYEGAWRFCTRGSFGSPQVAIAQELWDANPKFEATANKHFTYCFELVGPRNVNVVRNYERDELILLAIIDTDNDQELVQLGLKLYAERFGIRYARSYEWNAELFNMIKNNTDPNFEGIVIKLKNGLRFKLKSDLYCQLHRVITGDWTPKRTLDVWMSQHEGKMDLDPSIPDEFYTDLKLRLAEVEERWCEWQSEQRSVLLKARTQMIVCRTMKNDPDPAIRKLIAITIPEARPYLNLLFSNSIYSDWETFRPVAYQLFCKRELM